MNSGSQPDGDLTVTHRFGSYLVRIGEGVLATLPQLLEQMAAHHRKVIIADESVADKIRLPLDEALLLTFHSGESAKSRSEWERLTDALLAHQCGRDTVIVALGGGVATDLAGFVAATFLRGVPWIAVPTSTLGMIDASIGGKTGVDTPDGKNLVGAFHPPLAVLADTNTLSSLPEARYREGLAEAVKHAAILDAEYGAWMGANSQAILARKAEVLIPLIRRSASLKAEVVSGDEIEGGRRAILNAGHTVAHGLELATDYDIPHGEAVSLGLVLESRIAEQHGIARSGTTQLVISLLDSLHLPVTVPPGIDAERVMAALIQDKKNREGRVRAVLLERFGSVARDQGHWTFPIDPEEIFTALR